ncbi:hypothetical protein AA313_de0202015 [Arthrobotrys entomopaga]|nr:hypothetical protein AA313_de0202015 [Arthrobotrys entomopaga]
MSTPPLTTTLLQNPYLKNFITLLPFLFLGSLILFLLNRAESLRVGAGLQPPPQQPIPIPHPEPQSDDVGENNNQTDQNNQPQEAAEIEAEPEEEEVIEEEEEEEEVDVNEFLAEAGGIAGEGFEPDEFIDDNNNNNNAAGPANPTTPRPSRNRGIVGKKKARNLEMRDRRRAYNEFIQSEARERREREKELEEDLQEEIYAEKQRRALAEIKIEKQKQLEKEARREAEERNQKYKLALRGCVQNISGCGKVSLRVLGHRVGKDEEWVRKNLNVGDISAGRSEGVYSFVTESGWLVRIGKEEMAVLGKKLEGAGKMSWEDLSYELEDSLKRL